MRPIMKMLANAGQRAITASIMHKPWAGQTEDHYDSMSGNAVLLISCDVRPKWMNSQYF